MDQGLGQVSRSMPLLVDPVTLPFAVFRNRAAYATVPDVDASVDFSKGSGKEKDKANRCFAWQSSVYFNKCLTEHPISTNILGGRLLQEKEETKLQTTPALSTLSTCRHGNRTHLIHVAGKQMDEVVIRRASFDPNGPMQEMGFTLQLGRGAKILQVSPVGASSWNTSSHLLARTQSDVFHIQTIGLDDMCPPDRWTLSEGSAGISGRRKRLSTKTIERTVILEPLQKWQLPNEIICMSPSRTSWANATILSRTGHMYSWSPSDGLVLHAECPFVPQSVVNSFERELSLVPSRTNMECSLHPLVLHVSIGPSLYTADLRQPRLKSLHAGKQSNILSLTQHLTSAETLFVSSERHVSLIDVRFPKAAIGAHTVPEGHSNASYTPLDGIFGEIDGVENLGLLLGSSPISSQLIVHKLQLGAAVGLPFDKQLSASKLISAAQIGLEKCEMPCWDVMGFPVVDRTSNRATISGSAIVLSSVETKKAASSRAFEEGVSPDEVQGLGIKYGVQNAFLCQQSSVGDVFVQQLRISCNRIPRRALSYNPPQRIQSSVPCGVTISPSISEKLTPERIRRRVGIVVNTSKPAPDLQVDRYPLSSCDFLPFVDKASLRTTSEVDVKMHDVRRDGSASIVATMNGENERYCKGSSTASNDGNDIFTRECIEFIRSGVQTLSELWHVLPAGAEKTDPAELRQYLNNCPDIQEILLPSPPHTLPGSDGMSVVCSSHNAAPKCICRFSLDTSVKPCLQRDCEYLHRYIYRTLEQVPKFPARSTIRREKAEFSSDISQEIVSCVSMSW